MADQDANAPKGDTPQPNPSTGAQTPRDPQAAVENAQGAVDALRDAAESTPPSPDAEARASAALKAAHEAIATANSTQGDASKVELPDFQNVQSDATKPGDIDLLSDVNLHVKIELGRTRMFVEDVLRLTQGAVVELDKLAGDPVDVFVNDRHVARGEVLVVNDNFCVRISEILTVPQPTEEGAPTT